MSRQIRKKPGGRGEQAAPQVAGRLPESVLDRLQERFGNAVIERLVLQAPASAFELYLSDLIASEQATGHDFSAYLPGQAPQEWARFAQAWYRVLWAERTPDAETSGAAVSPQLDAGIEAAPGPQAAAGPEVAPTATPESPDAGSPVQRAARPGGAPDPADSLALADWFQDLRSRSGGGRTLTAAEQAFMTRVHGDALGDVRVHEGATAQQAAAEIQARAFTVDADIWLGQRADLTTRQGARLLAHEATHVLQNRSGRGAGAETRVSEPGQPLELEAETAERAAGRVWDERRAAWNFNPPTGLDSRADYLATWMLGRLPVEAGHAPDALVRDALRTLLAQRAQRRLADAGLSGSVDDRLAGELGSLRAAVAGASASRDGLLFLLRVAGTPSTSELAGLQDSFAPYPSFAGQLHQALSELAGDDPVGQTVAAAQGADTTDQATDAAQTLALVRELAPRLGLSADRVPVHLDSAASDKTRAAGTRGLAESGAIFLDVDSFDPGTRDARGLVAHELTHIAQESLAPGTGPDAGRLAETEAAETAWRAASGGSFSAPSHGLPTGHVAAEGGGGVDASAVVASFTAQKESTTATRGGIARPAAGPAGGQDPNASEDSDRKLEQYEDGVDGVCEMIEDLDAFDDLCDAIDDEEPTARHLSRVMANEHAGRLPQMWQGALEGGQVASQMQRVFNSEFDGRGFWEETELAFAMICRRAKSMARPEPEAAGAKAEAANAEANADQALEAGQGGEAGAEGGDAATSADVPQLDAAITAQLDTAVGDIAPVIPEFEALKGISDEQFAAITGSAEHRTAFCASPPDIEQGRGGQVFEALTENFLGSMTQSATDQFVDGVVWDNVGKLGDMGMSALTKGRLGTPFVGQVIALAQTPPWTGAAWGFGEGGPFNSFASGFGNLDRIGDAWGNAEDFGDHLALLCAGAAELVAMLRDLITGIRQVLSTLSSLCYVVGGILIIVGIALLWLAGVGAPLVSAGGWLTRMGGILSRINTVLGPAVMVLSGLATLLSTIAALTVPSELYAQQLQAVGEDAGGFGGAVGNKLGDTAAEMTNDAIASRFESRTSPPGNTEGDGSEGERLADNIDTSNQADLDRMATDAQDALSRDRGDAGLEPDGPARAPDGDDTTRAADGDDPARAQDGDDTPSRGRVRSFLDKIPMINRSVQGVEDGINDMRGAFSDPARFAQEGLSPQARAYVDGQMSERIQALDGQARTLQARVDELTADPTADPMEIGRVQNELSQTRDRVVQAAATLTLQREVVQGVEGTERTVQAVGDGEQDVRVIERDVAAKQADVDAAKAALRQAQEEHTRQTDAASEHTADTQHAQGDVNRSGQGASDLDSQATATDRAVSLQGPADESRASADSLRDALGGRSTSVEIDGVSRDRRVTDVRVNDDGSLSLQVEKTRGAADPRWVGADEIRSNRHRLEVLAAQTVEGTARTQQGEIDTLLAPYNGEIADTGALRTQAETERSHQQHAQDQVDRLGDNVPDSPNEDAVTSAQNRVTAADGELSALQQELAAARQASASAAESAGNDPNAASMARGQDNVSYRTNRTGGNAVAEHLRSTSSGNAMGGTGSSSKALGEGATAAIADWLVGLDRIKGLFPDNIAASAHVQNQAFTAGAMVENTTQAGLNALGMGHRETPQEIEALGQTQASHEERRRTAVEALMSCEAPVDYALFSEHRVTASTAYEAYINAHAEALRAYRAEVAVGEIAANTAELAETGKPVRERSQSMAGPLSQSQTTESQRQSTIAGGDSEVPAADSGMGGFVVDIISKVGDNSDEMDEQPGAGGSESGQQMADGQDTARDEAGSRSDQVQQASEANQEFLGQAQQLQTAQEGDVDTNISAMEDREQTEKGIQDEIKVKKAGHLVERDVQKAKVVENSAAFTSEFAQMEAWRADYQAKREAVEAEYS